MEFSTSVTTSTTTEISVCQLLDAVSARGTGAASELPAACNSFQMTGIVTGQYPPTSMQFRLEGSNDSVNWSEIVDSGSISPVSAGSYGPYSGSGTSYQYIRGNLEDFAWEESPAPTFTLWAVATS